MTSGRERQEKDIWKDLGVRLQEKKKTPAGFGLQKEPQTHPFYCSYRDPMDVWRTWGEESVPKTIFHFSKAISGESHTIPTPSRCPSILSPRVWVDRGKTNLKPTESKPFNSRISHERGLGEQRPAAEGQIQVRNFLWDPAGEDPFIPWKLPAHPLRE